MAAIWITSIIVCGIVAIVALCLHYRSKFRCNHQWVDAGQVEVSEGPRCRKLYYMCRCSKCGEMKSFRPVKD